MDSCWRHRGAGSRWPLASASRSRRCGRCRQSGGFRSCRWWPICLSPIARQGRWSSSTCRRSVVTGSPLFWSNGSAQPLPKPNAGPNSLTTAIVFSGINVSGYVFGVVVDFMPPTTCYCTFFRSPVDRVVSEYDYISRRVDHPRYELVARQSLETFALTSEITCAYAQFLGYRPIDGCAGGSGLRLPRLCSKRTSRTEYRLRALMPWPSRSCSGPG